MPATVRSPSTASEVRISVDIGGTFTDLVLEDGGRLELAKAPTVPHDPAEGILDVLTIAAEARGATRADLLAATDTFVHATTRGLNAVLTGTTARTAFLTTAGHPDVLLLREGGREDPFDFTVPFPEPYVPRSLTFEVPGRLTASGEELEPLDRAAVEAIAERLRAAEVEAVGVCLLWSTVNPAHELAVGEVLAERLPEVPHTLSHALNPSLREYRRASSACIDASLKPLMSRYLQDLGARLDGRGLRRPSAGASPRAAAWSTPMTWSQAPILSINSGPSMAPVAGREYAAADTGSTGGDRGRRRRDDLRRDPRPGRPDPVDPLGLGRAPVHRSHDRPAVDRREERGRGRGQHRVGRPGRPAARRPPERGCGARAGLLRPGRDRRHGHRRRRGPRPPRCRRLRRRVHAARRRGGGRRGAPGGGGAPRPRRRGSGGGHPAPDHRADGPGHRGDLPGAGHRPRRLGTGRRRGSGRAQRRGRGPAPRLQGAGATRRGRRPRRRRRPDVGPHRGLRSHRAHDQRCVPHRVGQRRR